MHKYERKAFIAVCVVQRHGYKYESNAFIAVCAALGHGLKYESEIRIVKGAKSADAVKLMAVMRLVVKCGESVEAEVEGTDESAACERMRAFFENNDL